jgi:hypothetical protein
MLHGAIAGAVRRYISHLEQHSVRQLSGSAGGPPGPSAAGGAGVPGSAAGSSSTAAGHRRGVSGSVTLGLGVSLAPPVAVGSVAGSAGGTGSTLRSATPPHAGRDGNNGAPNGAVGAGGVTEQVVSQELCVLLCNMAEVVSQQARLETMLLAAVRGDLSALAEAAVARDTQGRAHAAAAAAPAGAARKVGAAGGKDARVAANQAAVGARGRAAEESEDEDGSGGGSGSDVSLASVGDVALEVSEAVHGLGPHPGRQSASSSPSSPLHRPEGLNFLH